MPLQPPDLNGIPGLMHRQILQIFTKNFWRSRAEGNSIGGHEPAGTGAMRSPRKMSVTRAEWICHQNIDRFRSQLARAQDETQRILLRKLLREQETALAWLTGDAESSDTVSAAPNAGEERH